MAAPRLQSEQAQLSPVHAKAAVRRRSSDNRALCWHVLDDGVGIRLERPASAFRSGCPTCFRPPARLIDRLHPIATHKSSDRHKCGADVASIAAKPLSESVPELARDGTAVS
ncbi:hypothetical protein C490_18228 [Natronobacterium gregoryi SP2]|uniref:Uncharacterized protein n=1 Tax=Natronobacterium gregoryi (strain ATCC 43098 / DSM 3393 / CCM 3738 / CIP 104747 / IAM 13177 / JCM 8860 / NBRC 102187 / NCIMB 2189 / SP2) TaxID=797304 RepID=L9XLN9_NATGS|nr:hypothetical protein C490_18228 [Natronobacterium gregoryi SP2]